MARDGAIEEPRVRRWRRAALGAALAGALVGLPASGQILGPVGGALGGLPDVGQTVGRTTGDVLDRTDRLAGQALDPQALLDARARRLAEIIRRNSRFLEADDAGNPVVRGEVLAVGPSAGALAAARAAGFTVLRQSDVAALGLQAVVLAPPASLSVRAAVARLRRLDPAGSYDFNHVYAGAGVATAAPATAGGDGAEAATGVGARVGLIDTGLAETLPVFAGLRIETRGFAPGAPTAAAHGTATASLIAGRLGAFHGAAPGAGLYVADIFGATPAGGSAEALAQALAWMVEARAPVINVSLVGPPNALVAAAVRAVSARGARIVAAVGNDGPAAPPAYPASYPQVIAVTPVDAHGRVLPEAGHALHVDFAAPGAGISAANLAGGLSAVRGASFAAPIVAGRLASLMRGESPSDAAAALAELAKQARPAGRAAGHGVVGEDVRLTHR